MFKKFKVLSMLMVVTLVFSSLGLCVHADAKQLSQVTGAVDYEKNFADTGLTSYDMLSDGWTTTSGAPTFVQGSGITSNGVTTMYGSNLGNNYTVSGFQTMQAAYSGYTRYHLGDNLYVKLIFSGDTDTNSRTILVYNDGTSETIIADLFGTYSLPGWWAGKTFDFEFKVENGDKLTITLKRKENNDAVTTAVIESIQALLTEKNISDANPMGKFGIRQSYVSASYLKNVKISSNGTTSPAVADMEKVYNKNLADSNLTAYDITADGWTAEAAPTFTTGKGVATDNKKLIYDAKLGNSYTISGQATFADFAEPTRQKIYLGEKLWIELISTYSTNFSCHTRIRYGSEDSAITLIDLGNLEKNWNGKQVAFEFKVENGDKLTITLHRVTMNETAVTQTVNSIQTLLNENNITDINPLGRFGVKIGSGSFLEKVTIEKPEDMFKLTSLSEYDTTTKKLTGNIKSAVANLVDVTYVVAMYDATGCLIAADVIPYTTQETDFELINTTDTDPARMMVMVIDSMENLYPYVAAIRENVVVAE